MWITYDLCTELEELSTFLMENFEIYRVFRSI